MKSIRGEIYDRLWVNFGENLRVNRRVNLEDKLWWHLRENLEGKLGDNLAWVIQEHLKGVL